MRVCFTHLGCKLNQAELEELAVRFTAAGHEVVPRLEEADLHVVNSCTVTHAAARDSRKVARRGARVAARREGSEGGVATVLTGCWASERPGEAADLAGVDLVVPNDRKGSLLDLVHERFGAPPAASAGREPPAARFAERPSARALGHTRAAVKVEDGCDMGCSFCIIPSTRGSQVSRPLPEVVAEVAARVEAGAREVVLTGVQISHYRWRRHRLYDLVAAVLGETGVPRLRVTSIAPWKFDPRLLALFSDRRLCRHVHLSLQSGSAETLRRMRRPYGPERYARLVERLREAVPGIAVTTDVIVGFPGETDAEHAASLAFCREIGFARTHVFPYSVREGTAAAQLPDRVPHAVQRERMAEMLAVAEETREAFARGHVGSELEVLWEDRRGGLQRGTSDNYLRVTAPAERDLANRLTVAEIVGVGEGGSLAGRVPEDGGAPVLG